MNIDRAMELANSYYKNHGEIEISKVYDADTVWIIFGRKNGMVRFGNKGISINKETEEIKPFILPSDENFAILDAATLIEF